MISILQIFSVIHMELMGITSIDLYANTNLVNCYPNKTQMSTRAIECWSPYQQWSL